MRGSLCIVPYGIRRTRRSLAVPWKGTFAMNEFPSLDDFSVTEYGDIHLVDPRVVNVVQVAGKAHIEYCYENDEMLCSIDSNPDDGMWRWMIIQRRPCLYMDDGNLGGTESLISAYEEAKTAYLGHRETMNNLRRRIERQDDGLGGTLNDDVVVQIPNANAGEPDSIAYAGTAGLHYATDQHAPGYAYGEPPAVSEGMSAYNPLEGEDTLPDQDGVDYVEQTPLAAFDEFDDMLDRFFAQDGYDLSDDAVEPAYVDIGGSDYSEEPSIFDMDIDEFLGIDASEIPSVSSKSRRSDRTDDAFSQMIEMGLSGHPRIRREIRGDPE